MTLEDWVPTVEKIARFVSRNFPDTTTPDIEQEMYLYLLSHPDKFLDPEQDGVYRALTRIGFKIAWRFRKEQLYTTAQYNYLLDDVTQLFATIWDHGSWESGRVPEDAWSEHRDDWLDVHADVKWAVDQLPTEDQRLLFVRYALRQEFPGGSTEAKRVGRIRVKVQRLLNNYRGRGPARTAESNATISWKIGQNYE